MIGLTRERSGRRDWPIPPLFDSRGATGENSMRWRSRRLRERAAVTRDAQGADSENTSPPYGLAGRTGEKEFGDDKPSLMSTASQFLLSPNEPYSHPDDAYTPPFFDSGIRGGDNRRRCYLAHRRQHAAVIRPTEGADGENASPPRDLAAPSGEKQFPTNCV